MRTRHSREHKRQASHCFYFFCVLSTLYLVCRQENVLIFIHVHSHSLSSLQSVSSSKRDLEEDSTLLSLGGGAGGDYSNGYDAMDVVNETAEGGQGLSLRESLDAGSGDEYLGDQGRDGEGEEQEDVYDMSTTNKKNIIRFSEVSRLSMGGSGAGTGGRIESRGRKVLMYLYLYIYVHTYVLWSFVTPGTLTLPSSFLI